jgi:hypothetical protein
MLIGLGLGRLRSISLFHQWQKEEEERHKKEEEDFVAYTNVSRRSLDACSQLAC